MYICANFLYRDKKTRPKSRAGDKGNEKFREPGLHGRYVKSG